MRYLPLLPLVLVGLSGCIAVHDNPPPTTTTYVTPAPTTTYVTPAPSANYVTAPPPAYLSPSTTVIRSP
jgi:hypothetical protein